ncbi:MAG: DUF177 domain-containing protein [Actinobacteria bacterium]|nr:DUF177 domain-containing protein [Actinomycetota bacterium]
MQSAPKTLIDLNRLALRSGEGKRLELPIELEPFELGGQTYVADPAAPQVRLEVSRQSGGYAFHLTFPIHLEGPCMRCLEPAALEVEVEAREVDQAATEDEELRSPYVVDDELDIGRWAHDAAMLALPTTLLCRPECLGLCPVCGESLNDAAPGAHEHEQAPDPRWAALNDLKFE